MKREPIIVTRHILSDDQGDNPEVSIYHEFRMIITAKGVTYVIDRVRVSQKTYRDALATLAAGSGQRV